MRKPNWRTALVVAFWLATSALGCVVLGRNELSRLREAFETDARIIHRLLSQKTVQHDAVLSMLALLQPSDTTALAEQRLPSVYAQIVKVHRRDGSAEWPDARMREAERLSKNLRRPVLAQADFRIARYQMVLASEPTSFALEMDLLAVVPWNEWPMTREESPVRVALEYGGQSLVLQPGLAGESSWRFDFHKQLAADSQPFDVIATRQVAWSELPWLAMATLSLGVGLFMAGAAALARQRAGRQRAEELLRLGQVGRLNALGELAAGIAHELNQPLTAVLANTQAARRLLKDDPPELAAARGAMAQAVEQARRASEVVGRLRRVIERPGSAATVGAVSLLQAAQSVFYLLEPELNRCAVTPRLVAQADALNVLADPVALEQIIFNLVTNALQALEQVEPVQRQLTVELSRSARTGVLSVIDSGSGVAPDIFPRLFDPFFSTREKGLGLGLSLCATLAQGMGGELTAAHNDPRGAQFHLSLPLASL